jgi:hypothetical protein
MACRCSPAGAGCACVVDVADTSSVDMTATGTGDAATPRVISSVVKVSPAAGNTVVINPDGLFVPVPPAVPPVLGCGLESVAGAIAVNTAGPFSAMTRETCGDQFDGDARVAFPPACELNGVPVYCDSQGNLRTAPEKLYDSGFNTQVTNYPPPFITTMPFTSEEVTLSVTNPSACYCMCGELTMAFIPSISGAPGTVINIFHEVDFGTGVFAAITGVVMDNRGKTANASAVSRPFANINVCLAPGETKVFRHRVRYERFTGDNGGAVLITSNAHELRFFGSNL